MVRYASLLAACLLGSSAASLVPSEVALDQRSDKQASDDGRLHCGLFGSANKDRVSNFITELRSGKLKNKQYDIEAGQCRRIHCWDTSAIYVCNDSQHRLMLKAEQLVKAVECIFDNCCKDDYSGLKFNDGVSGQRFYSLLGSDFNIAVAYGNCNDPTEIRPSNAGGFKKDGGSINGNCMGGVRNPSYVECR